MCRLLIFLLLLLSFSPAHYGQTKKTVAERLGYPADARLLIIHADDLGVAHSVDAASFDALDKSAVTSASILMTCPWVSEVVAYAKAHPDADLGLHLTLTSEWETYRWSSLEAKAKVPSLLDAAGTLWSTERLVATNAKPAEAELEIRAQIERALALGIRPTHLDSHMGALYGTPELFAMFVRVAHEYHLPIRAARFQPVATSAQSPITDKDILLDAIVIEGSEAARDKWHEFYLEAVRNLKPGLNEMIVHLGYDDAELQAVTVNHEPYGSAWRQRDYNVVTSAEFQKALKENHVILIKWRDLQKLLAQP